MQCRAAPGPTLRNTGLEMMISQKTYHLLGCSSNRSLCICYNHAQSLFIYLFIFTLTSTLYYISVFDLSAICCVISRKFPVLDGLMCCVFVVDKSLPGQ